MKLALGLCLWWAGLLMAAAQSPVSRLERVPFNGEDYVRVEDWGRANGFALKWTLAKKEFRLVNGSTTLEFTVDSRKMVLNGTTVWLSLPIALRYPTPLIAPVDLSTAIHPVLFPPRNPASRPVRVICLDPGHGGKDPGNRESPYEEKKYVLLLARELSARLSKAGFKVYLTRSTDRFVDLAERVEYARRRNADLFLSLHYNAAVISSARGPEVYCMTPAYTSSTNARGEGAGTGAKPGNRNDAKNMLLAYKLQRTLVRALGMEDRGVKRARFQVLRDAPMPAALVEAGFMSNPTEARRIYDSEYRKRVAQAIVDGVLAYKNTVDVSTATKARR